MKIPILSARPGWHVDQLRRALAERGHEGIELRYERIVGRYGRGRGITCEGTPLDGAPAVIARIIPDGSLEQIIARVNVLHALEERGVFVLNSAAVIERTVDKSWTTALLDAAGLPTPETVVCETAEAATEAFRRLGDGILKPLFGSMGLGMLRLRDEDEAWRVFRTVERIGGVFYLQRTIDHRGGDLRAFVVGGRVAAAIERRSDGWRTNVARGGKALPATLTEAQHQLAIRAAEAVQADYAGVDIIPAEDGTDHVIEVNGIPGWRGLQEATGVDVAGAVIDHLLEELRQRGADESRE
jgi:RimK family alpha-L-glutamate ligase